MSTTLWPTFLAAPRRASSWSRTRSSICEGLERDAQDSPQLQRDLANAYDRLGDVQGDYIGANVGDTQGAIESYRRALNLQRGLVKRNPTIDARRELLRSCVN